MYNSNTCCNDNIATCIYLSSVATLIWLAQIFLLCLEIYCGLEYTKEKDLFNDHNQLRKREWGKYGIYVPPVVLFTDASRGTGILDIVGGPYFEGLTPSRSIIDEKPCSA